MTADLSLYDLLGGDRLALRTLTSAMYRKVLADDMLAPYFAGVDMYRQAVMLSEFLAMAFGGPDAYAGRDLRTAHAGLHGLTDAHFDKVVGYLGETMREFGVSEGDVVTATAVAQTARDDVLGR